MPRLFPALIIAALAALPATADPCKDEIAALFDGPLDPFQRPPHRQVVQVFDADGTQTQTYINTIETPLRTIAGVPGVHLTLVVDRDVWNGPNLDGPWTPMAGQMPEGREADMRRQQAELRDSLTDTECHGAGTDGRISYSYRSQTQPDATGGFFGSHTRIWIDPGIGQITRFELTDFVNAWTEGVSKERHEIDVEFDSSIKVMPPA